MILAQNVKRALVCSPLPVVTKINLSKMLPYNVSASFYILFHCTAPQIASWKENPALDALASTYVHMMIRRFTPSLATEIHLTARLLHVRVDATHGNLSKHLMEERSAVLGRSAVGTKSLEQVNGDGYAKNDKNSSTAVLFKTGMDCRSFATRVLLGLKSLLPHVGADMLDLLEGSLASAFEVQSYFNRGWFRML